MGKICHECEDPSWTGQDPIVAPVLPSGEGGGTTDFNQLQNLPKYGGVEMSGSTDIPNIEGLIPTTASSENQLADKAFVNSSVATNTAYFVGTFNTMEELEAVQNPSNNDYGFVIATDSAGNTVYNRYKFNSDTNSWVFEYALNNSSFTAAQWAAIQSGITSQGVEKLEALALIESVGEGLSLDANGELSFDKNLIGRARVLTAADYNWPVDNPTVVALWLLGPGVYAPADTSVKLRASASEGFFSGVAVVGGAPNGGQISILVATYGPTLRLYQTRVSDGYQVIVVNVRTPVNDNLTSTSTTSALSANQGRVLKDMIDALPTGGATELTSADYNWPVDNPDGVARWLLAPGYYECGEAIKMYYNTGSSGTTSTAKFWVLKDSDNRVVIASPSGGYIFLNSIAANGSSVGEPYNNAIVLTASQVVNKLTSTRAELPLSAAQGKVLNEKIGGDLSNLTTTDKTSLINAINELNTNLGAANTALQTLLNGTGA